jgi:putative transcriptional regulator
MGEKLHITNNIRKLRFFAGEMTRQTIIAMEADKYSPSLELAFRIAHAFGVSIGEVFECDRKGGARRAEHKKD